MREAEFENWLKWRGASSDNGLRTRIHAVSKIEEKLGELGSSSVTLDEAFEKDGFGHLRQKLKDMRDDARNGGQGYRILMPDSDKPLNRLSNWRSWLGQYGQFLASMHEPEVDDRFDVGMDKLRETFLERIYDFDNLSLVSGLYWDIEKSYKYAARGEVFSIAIDTNYHSSDEQRGKDMYERLCQSTKQGLPLSWRTRAEVLKSTLEFQTRFYQAIASLGKRDMPADQLAERAAREMEALRADGFTGLRRGEVLNIVLSVLGTLEPRESCWFKTSLFNEAARLLTGKGLFPSETFQIEEFEEFQSLLLRIQSRLDDWDWKPEHFEDVQGFLWVALTKEWDEVAMESDLTREAVEAAMDEFDEIGQDGFRNQYGFGTPTRYRVKRPSNGKLYPAKAIVGVAHGHIDGGQVLKVKQFHGGQGEQAANNILRNLGFQIVYGQGGVEQDDTTVSAGPFWFVGAAFGRTDDQLERFLSEGIWVIDSPSDRHRAQVLKMLPGQRIAIKSTYTRKQGLPFDNLGRKVSVMAIKATGTITANPGTGEQIEVAWDAPFALREWYHYTYQPTIWEVYPSKEMNRRLIAFAFDGQDQDHDWFRANLPRWQDTSADIDDEDIAPDARTYDPQNIVLYGPPGTGKTYRTMAEGVRGGVPEIAIEVKRSSAPKVERGFHLACDDLGIEKRWLIYPGAQAYPGLHGIRVMPLVDALAGIGGA